MAELHRHQKILALLAEHPFLSVTELTDATGVSAATVRRDIDKLEKAGFGQRVHGGIAAEKGHHARRAIPLPFMENRDIAVEQKRAIAAAASTLVRDGTSIIIHGGSTCFHFGMAIARRNLRVFTHSMPLAAYLAEYGECQLTIGGGDLHREPGIVYDRFADERAFYASQFFVGALGIERQGLMETNPLLVQLTRDMAAFANEIIVLVDSRKFAERTSTLSLPFAQIRRLVTDDGLADADARMLEEEGVDYIVAARKGETDA
ncbi:DeoR/GlpR transcriptional regulator [Martelella lutilitoris]|uniref:DeoR/GlpR transcriptional regulator n=1 Tax=Martelella lutilitoris TaxID=2583532 RepID=A0A7T7HJW9_9HYPH|nr:DeoR/GlpR family DNA-binding transcription regulator [Martelella lutilitoris]QQM30540.1 DeoR/GlpR transcriptional regulator [Martelella lutilitoris]